jgi:hypothetical protein
VKKVLAISLALNGAFVVLAVLGWKEFTVHAAGGGGTPKGNGDVNGDGAIDLSDAVYTLSWLFTGGPAPVAIECPPPGSKGALPATGQTKCYENVGGVITEVPCDQAACQGQDGQYAAGCPNEGRFVDNGEGTVTDTCTGLMWQKDTADVNGSGAIEKGFPGDRLAWCDALAYCENLSFAGHEDWRLPNVRELQSIVDYGRPGAIDPVFGAVHDWYWSSTTLLWKPYCAWLVDFSFGNVDADGRPNINGACKYNDYFVRAVRLGP